MRAAAAKRSGEEFRDAVQLQQLVEQGNVTKVESLLNAGANANAAGKTGMTLLMRAVASNQLATVKLLLDHGADVNACRDDGFNALLLAVFFGYTQLVRLLLQRGADSSAQGRCETTAEMWATVRGFTEIVSLLKKASEPHSAASDPLPRNFQSFTQRPKDQLIPESNVPLKVVRTTSIELVGEGAKHPVTDSELNPENMEKNVEQRKTLLESTMGIPSKSNNGSKTIDEVTSEFYLSTQLRSRPILVANLALATTLIIGFAGYAMLQTRSRQSDVPKLSIEHPDYSTTTSTKTINPQEQAATVISPGTEDTTTKSNGNSGVIETSITAATPTLRTSSSGEGDWPATPATTGTFSQPEHQEQQQIKETTSSPILDTSRNRGDRAGNTTRQSPKATLPASISEESSIEKSDSTTTEEQTGTRPAPLIIEASRRRIVSPPLGSNSEHGATPSKPNPAEQTYSKRKVIQWP